MLPALCFALALLVGAGSAAAEPLSGTGSFGDTRGCEPALDTGPGSGAEAAQRALEAGLCYARQDAFGYALWWLERARRLQPTDPRASEAILHVRDALRDERLAGERGPALEGEANAIRWWRRIDAMDPLLLLLIAVLGLWAPTLDLRRRRRHSPPTGASGSPRPGLASRALRLVGLAALASWLLLPRVAEHVQPALLLDDDPGAAWAPDPLALQQPSPWFREGSVVRIRDTQGAWTEVEALDGRRAWVRREAAASLLRERPPTAVRQPDDFPGRP